MKMQDAGDRQKSPYPLHNSRENAMRSRQKLFDVIRVIILLVALSVLLYPTVSNYLYEKNSSRAVTSYEESVVGLSGEEQDAMREAAVRYNQKLVGQDAAFTDPFSGDTDEVSAEYAELLDVNGTGMMGYIRIPKIDVELPIYHGTSEPVLQVGAGHISTTSLPVGGASTHAVLTGHRGLPSKRLFTDLDQIVEGDIFYLKVLNETLAYKVDQILTVLPHETEALQIAEGEDYVTLVTCTPYGVNTHRLLIRGHRIPYVEAVAAVPDEIDHGLKIPFEVLVLLIALLILVIIFIIWRILAHRKSRAAGISGSGDAQGRAGQDGRRRRHRRRRSRK